MQKKKIPVKEKKKIPVVESEPKRKLERNRVLSAQELEVLDSVQKALDLIYTPKEPDVVLQSYLDSYGSLADASDRVLETNLAVFISWQNFYGAELKKIETIKTVAEEQSKRFYSMAVGSLEGTITERKQLAFSDELYLKSVDVLNEIKSKYGSIEYMFNTCDRSYKGVSRIVRIREKER